MIWDGIFGLYVLYIKRQRRREGGEKRRGKMEGKGEKGVSERERERRGKGKRGSYNKN